LGIEQILSAILVFGILILFHELGHFITAKWTGMGVSEFAIGFGPKLLWKRKGETEYSIRLIPLGGYNKIDGMDPEEEQTERSFSGKPVWARALVIASGSFMNFVLPIILFTIIFTFSGAEKASDKPMIGALVPNKPAAISGLQAGDKIMSINDIPTITWNEVVQTIRTSNTKPLILRIEREGTQSEISVVPEFDSKYERQVIGIIPIITKEKFGIADSINAAFQQTIGIAKIMLIGIVNMIFGNAEPDLAGPIGVIQMAAQQSKLGIYPLLQFTAFLSINLGLINLLPIPLLDGGHIITLLVEAVRGKPLSKTQARFTQMVGLAFLLMILLLTTFKDIVRLNIF